MHFLVFQFFGLINSGECIETNTFLWVCDASTHNRVGTELFIITKENGWRSQISNPTKTLHLTSHCRINHCSSIDCINLLIFSDTSCRNSLKLCLSGSNPGNASRCISLILLSYLGMKVVGLRVVVVVVVVVGFSVTISNNSPLSSRFKNLLGMLAVSSSSRSSLTRIT